MKLTNYAAGLLVVLMTVSCQKTSLNENAKSVTEKTQKKSNRSSSNYIQNFYGVNEPRVFIVENGADETTSIKLTITWDADGVFSYTSETIPLDATAQNHRVFMPETEFNKDLAMLTPTHDEVKTVALYYQDGGIHVSEHLNANGIIYCWQCCGTPAFWNAGSCSWYCLGTPGQPATCTPALVPCGSYGTFDDILVIQTN
jgi:hypothetical protein